MILSFYSFVVNLISVFTSKIPDKVRNVMIQISIYIIAGVSLLRWMNPVFKPGDTVKTIHYIAVAMLIILFISSIDGKIDIKRIKTNRLFWAGWFICFISMFLLSFRNEVDLYYRHWSILSLTIFPGLFLVWESRGDCEKLFVRAARASIVMFWLYIIITFAFSPIADGSAFRAFVGVTANPNANGLICSGFFSSVLYMAARRNNKWFAYVATAGCMFALAYISDTRTTELLMGLEFLIYIIYTLRNSDNEKSLFRKLLLCVLILAIFVSFAFAFYHVLDMYSKTDYYANGEDTLELEEEASEAIDNINDVSSGRLAFWKAFISKSTLLGNGTPDEPLIEGKKASRKAHNNLIEVLYVSGYISALGFGLWLASGIIYSAKKTLGRKKMKVEELFAVLSFTGYFVELMLEVMIYPTAAFVSFTGTLALCLVAGGVEGKH
jgi:hypothetical protein